MATPATRSEKIDIRLTPAAKRILQSAAEVSGSKSVSEFVLSSALARAEETLPDRQRFMLKADQWHRFQQALDAPPKSLPRVTELLTTPSGFDDPQT